MHSQYFSMGKNRDNVAELDIKMFTDFKNANNFYQRDIEYFGLITNRYWERNINQYGLIFNHLNVNWEALREGSRQGFDLAIKG